MFAPRPLKTASFAGLALALLAGVSRAAEGEEKEGMPQLDPHSYASQLFWLAIFFILVFLFLRFIGLPRITAIMDERAKTIDSDIAAAELLRAQAAESEKTYEATMGTAHGEARALLAETYERNKAVLVEQTKQAASVAEREVNQAVKRVESERAAALHSIHEVARGLAADITTKLTGRAPDTDRLGRAVEHAVTEVV
jgi:F-type H+-transporting ATPase subunit b